MRRYRAFMLLALPILLLVAFGSDVANSGHEGLIIRAALAANPVGSCTSAGTDNQVYSLTGYKFPNTSMTFKTNQSTFPTYMSKSEVQSAIKSAFTTWDGATRRALFVDGGTTTAKANTKDGVNTVAFGNLGGGYVAAAYGWFNTSNVVIEFDITLSTSYTWATNVTKSGDCGGAANAFDVRNITTHEVGHPIGLNDLYGTSDKAQTMYGYAAYQELYKRTLASGDKKGVLVLFGP